MATATLSYILVSVKRGITKGGGNYLGEMLIQGTRRNANFAQERYADRPVARSLLARAHANTAVVALAAKMAWTVWALLRHEHVYELVAVAA